MGVDGDVRLGLDGDVAEVAGDENVAAEGRSGVAERHECAAGLTRRRLKVCRDCPARRDLEPAAEFEADVAGHHFPHRFGCEDAGGVAVEPEEEAGLGGGLLTFAGLGAGGGSEDARRGDDGPCKGQRQHEAKSAGEIRAGQPHRVAPWVSLGYQPEAVGRLEVLTLHVIGDDGEPVDEREREGSPEIVAGCVVVDAPVN